MLRFSEISCEKIATVVIMSELNDRVILREAGAVINKIISLFSNDRYKSYTFFNKKRCWRWEALGSRRTLAIGTYHVSGMRGAHRTSLRVPECLHAREDLISDRCTSA